MGSKPKKRKEKTKEAEKLRASSLELLSFELAAMANIAAMETPVAPPPTQEPAPSPVVVKPEPIRRGGFQYDGTFSTIDGVAFERPQHLLRLCYPSEPEKWKIKLGRGRPPKMEKITDMEASRTLSRKFMLAQFRFYGIPPPYQSSSDEVLAIFREQVTAGNVRFIPAFCVFVLRSFAYSCHFPPPRPLPVPLHHDDLDELRS